MTFKEDRHYFRNQSINQGRRWSHHPNWHDRPTHFELVFETRRLPEALAMFRKRQYYGIVQFYDSFRF